MKLIASLTLSLATAQYVLGVPGLIRPTQGLSVRSRPHKRCTAAPSCPKETTFESISAHDWVAAASPGWNAGNSLDAIPNEGSWNNPILQESTFDYVKTVGFKSVRIPVTYAEHYVSGSPTWTIDPKWLQRVSDVVDMATSRGFQVITNMHHDSWSWADVSQSSANQTMIQEKFYASWLQIGKKLACKPSSVAFEPINEPPGNNAGDGERLMKLNDLFLQALKDSGGFNSKRVVTLSGPGMGLEKIQWFKASGNITNPWAFQFHYYSPYDFIFGAWGKTTWGSPTDYAAVTTDLTSARGNFTNVPLLLGEFSASQLQCEPAARWKWTDHVVRTAALLNITTILWDNGLDNLDRGTGTWRDQVAVDLITHAARGVRNSLPSSTTDGSASSQGSSAYVFNKVGEGVAGDQRLGFELNGNVFEGLAVGGVKLEEGRDYSVGEGGELILKKGFLEGYLSAEAEPGSKANITVEFSAGAASQIELVQWDTPVLALGAYASSTRDVAVGADLSIPIVWKGLHRVAAVRIVKGDGAYLVDDWTQWLGPLQQGRGTLNSQWNYDYDRIIITRSAVDAVIASGQNTTFTFEFYPRVAGNGNMLNYTLTV